MTTNHIMAGDHVRGIVSKEVAAKFGIPVNVIRIEDAVVTSTWDPINTGSENDMCISLIHLDAGMSYFGICEVCSNDFEVIEPKKLKVGDLVSSNCKAHDSRGRWIKPIRQARICAIAPEANFDICIEDILFKDGSITSVSFAWMRSTVLDAIKKPQEYQIDYLTDKDLTDKEKAKIKNFINMPHRKLTSDELQAIVEMLYIMYKSKGGIIR